ncbi:hypothetical protein LEP1GSC052_0657 [Leptospira kmetyi serovar Malaysia str. Bejo-Iso9]|nr:hypothetical protein LEP1GSC052_0657 [Leptospira kmetyi serovar Malaysia str. Bejo-Iso9]
MFASKFDIHYNSHFREEARIAKSYFSEFIELSRSGKSP